MVSEHAQKKCDALQCDALQACSDCSVILYTPPAAGETWTGSVAQA